MLNKNQDHNVVQSFNIIEMLPEELKYACANLRRSSKSVKRNDQIMLFSGRQMKEKKLQKPLPFTYQDI